jgi:hypothetical protein
MMVRFELEDVDCPHLPQEAAALLFELNVDELVKLSPLQTSFNRYIDAEKKRADWTQ